MSSYSVVKEGMNNISYQKEVTPPMKRKRGAKSNPNAFKRLKELPFFDELDRRIKMNIAVEELAKWIQEDRMQMTDIKRDSLVRQLYRYKAAIPPGEIAEVEPMFFAKSIEKLKRGVNEIEELEKLYLFQLRRISMDGATAGLHDTQASSLSPSESRLSPGCLPASLFPSPSALPSLLSSFLSSPNTSLN